MFQRLKINDAMGTVLPGMFSDLGEPVQVLTPDSPRPLVVHRVMSQATYVRSGSGLVSLAGETFTLEPGDLLMLAPGCEHAFLAPDGDLELLHWHWPQALLHSDREIVAPYFEFGPPDPGPGGPR
ncbi:cupin domain-containing protein [Longispora urticae]